nr:unnamed protein product [Callosobruchus analis]
MELSKLGGCNRRQTCKFKLHPTLDLLYFRYKKLPAWY